MSDQYGYNQGYGQQYPSQQGYNQQYPPQQGYPSQQGYPPQQGGYPPQQSYGQPEQNYGPPQRQDSFGPPAQGGFNHGMDNRPYGTYDSSNPQGHAGYYGGYPQNNNQGPPPQQHAGDPNYDAFRANQEYQNSMNTGNQNPNPQAVQNHNFAPQSSDPNAPNYDPNAPPMTEQDRGLLGAAMGGAGGYFFGKKSSHGLLGTVGGAILGSLGEDFMKKKKKDHHSSGGSSWGGGSRY